MMTLLDSLQSRHVRTRSRQTRRDSRRPGRRAVLEFQPGRDLIALEDRTLLSSVNWINPAGGDWDAGSNWNTGSVPGASDDVAVDLPPGITVTHSQNDADSVSTLTLASADTLSISKGEELQRPQPGPDFHRVGPRPRPVFEEGLQGRPGPVHDRRQDEPDRAVPDRHQARNAPAHQQELHL
jgi:hypothetical protein